MTQLPPQNEPPRRFIDFQLSLQAVISGTVVVGTFMVWMGWQASQQTTNMAQLQQTISKVEKRFDERDTKVDNLKDAQYEARRQLDLLDQRVGNLERYRK